jgi:hypothetical protein
MAIKTKKVDRRTKKYKDAQAKKKAAEAFKLYSENRGDTYTTTTAEEIEESRLIVAIKTYVPKPVLEQLYTMIECTCTIDAITHFMEVPFPVTREMQIALNEYHYTLFNERVRKTSCSTCIAKRIGRIRTKMAELIEW